MEDGRVGPRFLGRLGVFLRIVAPFVLIVLALFVVAREIRRHHPDQETLWPSREEIVAYFERLARKKNPSSEDKYLYCGIVFLVTLSCLPVSPFEIAAGYIFGWEAMLVALPGKIGGSIAAFALGRFFWADILSRRLAHRQTFVALQLALAQNEWRFMFLIRLMYVPQWAKNYGLSVLSSARLSVFAVATTVVSLGFSVLFTYIGTTSDQLVVQVEQGGVLSIAILAFGLGTAIVGSLYISAAVQREAALLQTPFALIGEGEPHQARSHSAEYI